MTQAGAENHESGVSGIEVQHKISFSEPNGEPVIDYQAPTILRPIETKTPFVRYVTRATYSWAGAGLFTYTWRGGSLEHQHRPGSLGPGRALFGRTREIQACRNALWVSRKSPVRKWSEKMGWRNPDQAYYTTALVCLNGHEIDRD